MCFAYSCFGIITRWDSPRWCFSFSPNSLQWGDGRRRKKLKKRAARVPKPLSSDFYCGSAPSLNDAVVCADRGLAKLPKSKMKQLETVLTDSQTFVIYLFLADMNSLLNSKIAHHLNSSLQRARVSSVTSCIEERALRQSVISSRYVGPGPCAALSSITALVCA